MSRRRNLGKGGKEGLAMAEVNRLLSPSDQSDVKKGHRKKLFLKLHELLKRKERGRRQPFERSLEDLCRKVEGELQVPALKALKLDDEDISLLADLLDAANEAMQRGEKGAPKWPLETMVPLLFPIVQGMEDSIARGREGRAKKEQEAAAEEQKTQNDKEAKELAEALNYFQERRSREERASAADGQDSSADMPPKRHNKKGSSKKKSSGAPSPKPEAAASSSAAPSEAVNTTEPAVPVRPSLGDPMKEIMNAVLESSGTDSFVPSSVWESMKATVEKNSRLLEGFKEPVSEDLFNLFQGDGNEPSIAIQIGMGYEEELKRRRNNKKKNKAGASATVPASQSASSSNGASASSNAKGKEAVGNTVKQEKETSGVRPGPHDHVVEKCEEEEEQKLKFLKDSYEFLREWELERKEDAEADEDSDEEKEEDKENKDKEEEESTDDKKEIDVDTIFTVTRFLSEHKDQIFASAEDEADEDELDMDMLFQQILASKKD